MNEEFHVLQLDENCYYVIHSGMQTRIHFGSVGNPFFATKLGDIEIVKQNLLPEKFQKCQNHESQSTSLRTYRLRLGTYNVT